MILLSAGLLPAGLRAETVSQKEAMQKAQIFMNQANGRVMAPVKMVYNGRYLTIGRLFVPFYVYNEPAGGFVIISAENKTFPILGYSLKENFDPDHLGEKEKALLTSYARDIEMIRYDNRVPEEAIKAWQDYPGYIIALLNAPYEATDPTFTMEEATERLDRIVDTGLAEETASDIYSPGQWEDMIDRELDLNRSVALGIVERGRVFPTIVYGRKGDFYRIELDRRNQWLMRLLPSELLSGIQIADFSYPATIPLKEETVPEFALYDEFIAEQTAAREAELKKAEISDSMIPQEPIVESIGGGRFSIYLPENIRMMTIYNLGGAISNIRTFKDTNVAHADISHEPSGFYFASILGESGKTYGVKLAR